MKLGRPLRAFTNCQHDNMLALYMLSSCVCPSVCHKPALYKRLNVGSRKQHHTIARGLWCFVAKDLVEIPTGSSPTAAQNRGEVNQMAIFDTIR